MDCEMERVLGVAKRDSKNWRESPVPEEAPTRARIGVVLGPVGDLNTVATRYLILQLNGLQDSLEFEILPEPSKDPLWNLLSSRQPIAREAVKECARGFATRYARYWGDLLSQSIASESVPDHIVVVSLARFADNFYSTTLDRLAILALGNWKRYMAPPSLIEFISVLVVRLAIGLVDPSVRRSSHLGTRGCLWDFNPYLDEVRFKVLVGRVCPACQAALRSGPLAPLADQLPTLLSRAWLGKRDEPQSVAATCAKLGYDLFSTKGARPNVRERLTSVVQEEGAKEILKWLSAFLLAAILVWLGLKKP